MNFLRKKKIRKINPNNNTSALQRFCVGFLTIFTCGVVTQSKEDKKKIRRRKWFRNNKVGVTSQELPQTVQKTCKVTCEDKTKNSWRKRWFRNNKVGIASQDVPQTVKTTCLVISNEDKTKKSWRKRWFRNNKVGITQDHLQIINTMCDAPNSSTIEVKETNIQVDKNKSRWRKNWFRNNKVGITHNRIETVNIPCDAPEIKPTISTEKVTKTPIPPAAVPSFMTNTVSTVSSISLTPSLPEDLDSGGNATSPYSVLKSTSLPAMSRISTNETVSLPFTESFESKKDRIEKAEFLSSIREGSYLKLSRMRSCFESVDRLEAYNACSESSMELRMDHLLERFQSMEKRQQDVSLSCFILAYQPSSQKFSLFAKLD